MGDQDEQEADALPPTGCDAGILEGKGMIHIQEYAFLGSCLAVPKLLHGSNRCQC